jgi:hypothetical protein
MIAQYQIGQHCSILRESVSNANIDTNISNDPDTHIDTNIGSNDPDTHIDTIIGSNDPDTHIDTNIGSNNPDTHIDTNIGSNNPDTHIDTIIGSNNPDTHIDTIIGSNNPDTHIDTIIGSNNPDTHTDAHDQSNVILEHPKQDVSCEHFNYEQDENIMQDLTELYDNDQANAEPNTQNLLRSEPIILCHNHSKAIRNVIESNPLHGEFVDELESMSEEALIDKHTKEKLIDVSDFYDVLANLQCLSEIKENDKLAIYDNKINIDMRYCKWAIRQWYGDSRENTLLAIRKCINKAKQHLLCGMACIAHNVHNKQNKQMLLDHLIKCPMGLSNLKITYSTDEQFKTSIDLNLRKIRSLINMYST